MKNHGTSSVYKVYRVINYADDYRGATKGGGWGVEGCRLPSSFQGGKRILKKKEKKLENRWNERHDSLLNNWTKFVRPHPPFFRPPLHSYSCVTVALRMLVLHISISTCRFNKSPLVREDGKKVFYRHKKMAGVCCILFGNHPNRILFICF